ncbi:unnamed protein product [Mycena citricolor]|uniref:Tyrosine specific protein phosphatases domain-containing protein n=1 Tax=Mycena citricolor TaxID=2018698 RepID=A0AAD2H0P3_9AGAR|nr:unnamed protein product [Mycena citricolor]
MSESAVRSTPGGGLVLSGLAVDDMATNVLHLVPPTIQQRRDFRIVLISDEESASLSPVQKAASASIDTAQLNAVGLGSGSTTVPDVFFLVVVWAAGQLFRKRAGLPPAQFHVQLSVHDDLDADKSVASLLPDQFPDSPSAELLDHLAFTLHLSSLFDDAEKYSAMLVRAFPESQRGYLRLGDSAMGSQKHKLAMLAYGCAFSRAGDDQRTQTYVLKKMFECAQHTEWGSVVRSEEIEQIPGGISDILFAPWPDGLRDALAERDDFMPTLQLEPRRPLFIPGPTRKPALFKLPRWFRWLVPYHLAIMSTPKNEEDIAALASPHLGIRHVLTLTEEEPLPRKWFHGKPITNSFCPIPNLEPPSLEQMELIMRLFDDQTKLPLLVHCGGGKGRAGTVAACYLAAYGFRRPVMHQDHPEMAASDAIASLRLLRPGSLETSRQEAFVSTWCSAIWKRRAVKADGVPEPPPCELDIQGEPLVAPNDLFMLVGLPGSGKSWFSQAVCARNPSGWRRISQDESGSRASCETEIGRKGRTLLDRCNASAADRKIWLALASNWVESPVCIWFDYDRSLCESRAQRRMTHPTLPPGSRVRNAIAQMHNTFDEPSLSEGFKTIVRVKSFEAAAELVERLSPPLGVYKFPRTPHLLNLGSATDDDVFTDTGALRHSHVVITEKVDGANMGFWLSPARELRIQNRSHYVSPASHEQFKKLGLWVDTHRNALVRVLGRDAHFPSRYVLYGEWLAATHAIPYETLPDRFLAFDLYDRRTDTWASRAALAALLHDTAFHLVPLLYEGPMPVDAQLREMVGRGSLFYAGRVEGVYVKGERDGVVVSRGKVVRADFIAGNEHWTRGKLRLNGLARQ